LGWSVPTCKVYDYGNNATVYASKQTIYGNLVVMNLDAVLPKAAVFVLDCGGLKTRESNGIYFNRDVHLRIADVSNVITHESAPAEHNTNWDLGFTQTLKYLNWAKVGTIQNPLHIYRGTYSAPLQLLIGERSARNFNISVSPSNFNFWPTQFNISTGTETASTLLGTTASTRPGLYRVSFTSSDSSVYTHPTSQLVVVDSQKVNVVVSPAAGTTINILQVSNATTKTIPIVFDVSAHLPYSNITITPTIPAKANFTVSPASLSLSALKPSGQFVYSTTANTLATETATITYAITGGSAAAYNTIQAHTLKAVADTTISGLSPTITMAEAAGTAKATSKDVTFTLGEVDNGNCFYTVYVSNTLNEDIETIWNNAVNAAPYDINSPTQVQYGQVQLTKGTAKTITIGNLFPGTKYDLKAFVNSLANRNSTAANLTFTTASNGAAIQRWVFNFTNYPTATNRQQLLCSLTQTLQVPTWNVRTIHGETCGNPANFYSTENSTGDVAVYFYPLQVEKDEVMSKLNDTLTADKLKTINSSITTNNGKGFDSAYQDGIVKGQAVNSSVTTTPTVGTTWVALQNISLTDPGFVYCGIATNSTTTPSASDLKLGNGVMKREVLYYPGSGTVSVNFTNLTQGTKYNVYVASTNNDPSPLALTSAVNSIAATTTSPTTAPPAMNAVGLACSLIVALISSFALLLI
jgi:hypothetical protein